MATRQTRQRRRRTGKIEAACDGARSYCRSGWGGAGRGSGTRGAPAYTQWAGLRFDWRRAVKRDPRLVTDIDSEPSPASDDGRLLALLESRLHSRVPVYEVEGAARLQYAARVHSVR